MTFELLYEHSSPIHVCPPQPHNLPPQQPLNLSSPITWAISTYLTHLPNAIRRNNSEWLSHPLEGPLHLLYFTFTLSQTPSLLSDRWATVVFCTGTCTLSFQSSLQNIAVKCRMLSVLIFLPENTMTVILATSLWHTQKTLRYFCTFFS